MGIQNRQKNSIFINYFLFSLGIAVFFVIYFAISYSKKDSSMAFVFPGWGEIFSSIGSILTNKTSLISLGWSFLRIIVMIITSFVLSNLISFIYVCYKPSINFLKPFIFFIKTAPIAAISIYLWLSVGSEGAPYIVGGMVIFPLMLEADLTSIDNIDKNILDELKISGANKFEQFIKIYLPITAPYQVMSILQGFGLGFKVGIMSEYLVYTKNSVGSLLHNYFDNFQVAYLLGMVFIVVVIVLIIDGIMQLYKKHLEKSL
jgi:NitT/TauT family transport system permease protein